METEAAVSTTVKKRPLWQRGWFLASVAICVILVAVVGIGAMLFIFPLKVEGTAMSPTINHGDRIFNLRTAGRIERGEIVVFYYPKQPTKSFIKRVIALPGDKIRIDDMGGLYINGNLTPEPYLSSDRHRSPRGMAELSIPADEYFVMGDDRDASNDSRSWGTVPRRLIYAKYLCRYWAASD